MASRDRLASAWQGQGTDLPKWDLVTRMREASLKAAAMRLAAARR